MKRAYPLGLILLTACLCTLSLMALAEITATIDGRVSEAGSDKPLEGVRVVTSLGTSTLTDVEGRFVLRGVPTGRMRIFPEKSGFVYSRPNTLYPREPGVWIEVASGDRLQNVELRMVKEAAISGRILDSLGQPVPTAGVTVLVRSFDDTGKPTLTRAPGTPYNFAMVRTNDRGEFRLSGLPPRDYYLRVHPGGLGPVSTGFYPGVTDESSARSIRVNSGEEFWTDTITLARQEKTANVHLRFQDGAQLPSSRQVTIAPDISLSFAPPMRDELVIPGVRPGDHRVLVSWRFLPGILYGFADVHVDGAYINQALTIRRAARVSTQITLEDQSGTRTSVPPFSAVGIKCSFRAEPPLITASCNGDIIPGGRYSLDLQGIPEDAYVVSAEVDGQDILSADLEVRGDINLNVLLRTPGGSLEGTVLNPKNERVADAVVVLIPNFPVTPNSRLYRSTTSDLNGRFRIQGIAPGDYRVFAWPDLQENAYRNAEFMKVFADRGTAIQVEEGARHSLAIVAF
jgi:hypothetical protein